MWRKPSYLVSGRCIIMRGTNDNLATISQIIDMVLRGNDKETPGPLSFSLTPSGSSSTLLAAHTKMPHTQKQNSINWSPCLCSLLRPLEITLP